MKILVTGGAGFIGSHIADAYINQGHQVIIIDNLSTGVSANLNPQVKFYELDIRSAEAAQVIRTQAPDLINHHAAQIRVDIAAKDPIFDAQINILGFLNLLQAAKDVKSVKKIILASTGGAMYGPKPTPFVETMLPQPLSPYGISKLADERYLYFYHQQYGIDYVALRYANVYGPRQNPHGEAGVVAIFCNNFLTGKPPVINGDGQQTRDYVYISDVVIANLLATKKSIIGDFNIGTGIETDVNQIYDLVRQEFNSDQQAVHGPARPGEQATSSLDSSLAKEKLDWQPTVSLSAGIHLTVEFFKHQKSLTT